MEDDLVEAFQTTKVDVDFDHIVVVCASQVYEARDKESVLIRR